jgi:hypothetical protein
MGYDVVVAVLYGGEGMAAMGMLGVAAASVRAN